MLTFPSFFEKASPFAGSCYYSEQDPRNDAWRADVLVMGKPKPAFPNDLDGIRNKIATVVADIDAIRQEIQKPSVWSWKYWEEHKAKLTVLVFAFSLLTSASGYVLNLILESHIRSGLGPIQQQLSALNSKVDTLSGVVSVLQTQVAAQRYANLPAKALKARKEEIKQLRSSLEQTPKTTPGYWPVAFQVITLASQVEFPQEMEKLLERPEGVFDNVVSDPPGMMSPVRNGHVVLRNLVQGMTFIDSVVRFDPSVRLANDTFINCVFIFPSDANPPQPLRQIGQTLLASDLSRVILNGS